MIDKFFEVVDVKWCVFGVFLKSGFELRKEWKDFEIRSFYKVEVFKNLFDFEKGCCCGVVLRGLVLFIDCFFFGKICMLRYLVGLCMVFYEGDRKSVV